MSNKRELIRREIERIKNRDPHDNFTILEDNKIEVRWTNKDTEIIEVRLTVEN